jgi:endoglucanase
MTEQRVLPRWRGFNLLEMFLESQGDRYDGKFRENDFKWIADWGFDFVRIPMTYVRFVEGDDLWTMREDELANVDRAVELGSIYGIHVCLNFHRAPGYCVNNSRCEPFNLWRDKEAEDLFCHYWETFARRYRGVARDRLSFNLVNEPKTPKEIDPRADMSESDYERVVRRAVAAIRKIDPDRIIIVDGVSFGNRPMPQLRDLGVVQSCRAYLPMQISHYQADWVRGMRQVEPAWPLTLSSGETWNRDALVRHYQDWAAVGDKGAGVHCGEGGAYSRTPHKVVLDWLDDVLSVLTELGIGYALWNFRGAFGVLNSGREDVRYADWYGHKLDKELLELLQRY